MTTTTTMKTRSCLSAIGKLAADGMGRPYHVLCIHRICAILDSEPSPSTWASPVLGFGQTELEEGRIYYTAVRLHGWMGRNKRWNCILILGVWEMG
jgi:hypothetical protein